MSLQIPIQFKDKPWGREIWFANTHGYVGKILEVKKGKRLSLQYHEKKCETQYLFSGKVKLIIGSLEKESEKNSQEHILNPGDKYDIFPYTVHRVEALEDSIIFEVSTSELEDVIRLSDDYGRPDRGNDENLDKTLSKN